MRYFHDLYVGQFSSDNLFDDNGNYIAVKPIFSYLCNCRAENNSGGEKISGEDGTHLNYSFVIYLEKDCENIDTGTLIEVKNGDTVIYSGQAVYFARNRKNCVLWV